MDIEQEIGIAKENGTLEAVEKIIDPDVPSLVEVELLVTIFTVNIATPEETPGVCISSWVISQTKLDYIPSIPGKKYETLNTLLKREEILHPDAHIFFCQELIEEVPDTESVIMM